LFGLPLQLPLSPVRRGVAAVQRRAPIRPFDVGFVAQKPKCRLLCVAWALESG
jgi:hypothetical protein